MKTFRLRRPGEVDLEFVGEQLANVSSRRDDAPRWTEIRLYRTDTGRYVTEQIGRSLMPEEHDRILVCVLDTATEARDSLRLSHHKFLTNLAVRALAVAASHDPAIEAIATERL